MDWLVKNATEIGVMFTVLAFVLSVGVLAFSAYKYVSIKRKDQMQIEFDHYHKLIAQLVGSDKKGTTTKLDSQVAIIYELQLPRFKRYRPVTKRILQGLHEEWKGTSHKRLLKEMELAISAFEK
ncbi:MULTISPECIES: hypothetical protein [Vibrio]|uniref:hypothetical protein n=1 Tax=Vibrio TaxID=662 RepID=UPI00051D3486|nr:MULTISPECIES: hypothetical protein [Vibrio]KGK08523.1 hypothetical protein EA24_02490 [Vibrio navarrensis]MBN8110198.1 hypothetical protein [Vibrio vulnificus]PUZ81056.1 hypothetical protein DC360_21655 [Vibrio vulnificus]TOF61726.1 hypothetical protein CGJ19_23725 [Vibrio parahaemolyticus]HAT8522037.1 hypothetical protein [Vibrio vulnificus]